MPCLAHAQIAISEIFYDAPGTDSHHEWVEIQNISSAIVNLTKWKIYDGANHALNIPPKNGGIGSLLLAPNAYAILASDASTFRSIYPGIDSAIIDTSLSLNNDSESISLLNASDTIVVSAGYSSADGASGDGNSLQRKGSGWISASPTPGSANATVSTHRSNAKQLPPPKPAKASRVVNTAAVSKKSSAHTAFAKKSAYVAAADTKVLEAQSDVPEITSFSTSGRAQAVSVFSINDMWMWAVVGLVVLVAAGILSARYIARDEWEIEDIDESE